MSSIEINGSRFEYHELGKGEPLVLVHGSASDYRTWQNQLVEFSKRYRVITYSRRYHWPNEKIPQDADYSMWDHVADLKALAQELNAVPANYVGHSYGAFLCLLLAIKEPHLVRSLVLAEPPVITLFVSNSPKPTEILKLLLTRPSAAFAVIKFGVKGVAPAEAAARNGDVKKAMRLFGKTLLGPKFYPKLTDRRLEQIDANAIKAEFLGSGFARINAEQLQSVRAPTLLITGRHSNRLFHYLMDELEELIQHSQRIEIEGASHIMHEDNVVAYNQAVQSFLEQNADSGDNMPISGM